MSPTERLLRAERVSVNSYKSAKMEKVLRSKCLTSDAPLNNYTNNYRTNNHAGLPKGAYCSPHPTHFHIIRQTLIAQPMRPILVRIAPPTRSSHYIFNRLNVNCNRYGETVTINVGNVRAVSLTMSTATISDFILPFANALNMINQAPANHQQCQTSYLVTSGLNEDKREINYTPLITTRERSAITGNGTNNETDDFEQEILTNLKKNLISDLTNSEDDSEIEQEQSLMEDKEDERIVQVLDDSDWLKPNESLADVLSPQNNSRRCLLDAFNNSDVAGNSPEISSSISSLSPDEGVMSDLSKTSPINEQLNSVSPTRKFDEKIIKLGGVIYAYMQEHCFENCELVIFPEILHDLDTSKFLASLRELFLELYTFELSSEDFSEIRLTLASYVLSLIESKDKMLLSTESLDSNLVSDKVFSISENLSAILDHFFGLIETNCDFDDFAQENNNIEHSTPDRLENKYEIIEEVTSFKKDQKKSGAETYWFAIGSPVERKVEPEPTPKKEVINVDDILLPPPKDLTNLSRCSERLSPIEEEANRNLYFDFLECDNQDLEDILGGGDNERVDSVLNGQTANNNSPVFSYVAFDRPESNVVVSCGATFYRTLTTNSSSFVKSSSVIFEKYNGNNDGNGNESFYSVASHCSNEIVSVNNNNNNDSDEGDWMGYEAAKF